MNLFALPCLSIGFIALQPRAQVPGSLQPRPNSWHCAVNKQTQARNVVEKLAQLISTATLPLQGCTWRMTVENSTYGCRQRLAPALLAITRVLLPEMGRCPSSHKRSDSMSFLSRWLLRAPSSSFGCSASFSNRSFLQLISHLRAHPHLSRWLLLATLSIVQPKQCNTNI